MLSTHQIERLVGGLLILVIILMIASAGNMGGKW